MADYSHTKAYFSAKEWTHKKPGEVREKGNRSYQFDYFGWLHYCLISPPKNSAACSGIRKCVVRLRRPSLAGKLSVPSKQKRTSVQGHPSEMSKQVYQLSDPSSSQMLLTVIPRENTRTHLIGYSVMHPHASILGYTHVPYREIYPSKWLSRWTTSSEENLHVAGLQLM